MNKKEIVIPLGYEARIEGNKIILELKESNDERTRKSLLEFLNDVWHMGKNANFDKWGKADCADWISYIEKKRESTWTEEDDNFERNVLPRILNPNKWTLEQNNADKHYLEEFVNRQKNKSIEKQKEQKPAENISQLIVKGKGAYKICPHCKSRMIRDDSKVYTSMPPQYGYNCPKCGTIEFDTVMYDSPEIEEQKPAEWSDSVAKEMFIKALERAVEQTKKGYELTDCDKHSWWEDFKAYSGIKPAEWSEEDELKRNNLIGLVEEIKRQPLKKLEDWDGYINFLKSLPERFNLQSKQEWSKEEKERIRQNGRLDVCYNPEKYGLCHKVEWGEEEMEMLVSIIDDYEMAAKSFCGNDGKIMFLKAIRDGEYGLSKQEWSEEDKKFIKELCNLLASIAKNNYVGGYYAPDLVSKLQSLRPHPHWKPSDEQIRPLEYAIEYFKKKKNDTTYLESLLNGLNKL